MKFTKPQTTIFFLIMAVIALLQFSWQLIPLEYSWSVTGRYPALDPDSLLYLRWFEQSILSSETIKVDTYCPFPNEYRIGIPVAFLSTLIYFTRFCCIFFRNISLPIEMIAGFFPPLLGLVFYILSIFFVNKISNSKSLCLLFGIGLLSSSATGNIFSYMMVDHHCIETFCIWSWLYLAVLHSENPSKYYEFAGGIITSIFALYWLGAPFFFIMFLSYLVLLIFISESFPRSLLELTSSGTLIGSGLLMIYFILFPPVSNLFSITIHGWFHVSAIFTVGLICKIISLTPESIIKQKKVILISLLVVFGFSILVFQNQLSEAEVFVNRKNPLMASISELQPVIGEDGNFSFYFLMKKYFAMFGVLIFFLPLAVFTFKNFFRVNSSFILRDWILILLILGSWQLRYFRWFDPAFALIFAILILELIDHIKILLKRNGMLRTNRISIQSTIITAVIVCPLIIFTLEKNISSLTPTGLGKDYTEALAWFTINTPETGGYFDNKKPEYGILSFWSHGNSIAYYTKRPVVAGNNLLGLSLMSKILKSFSEAEAYELCLRNKIKYIFLNPIGDRKNTWDVFEHFSGISSNTRTLEINTTSPKNAVKNFEKSLYGWLADRFAIFPVGNYRESSAHFRCRFISRNAWDNVKPNCYIFEVVSGAEITGNADPGTEVEISLLCNFDQAKVTYKRKCKSLSDGTFSLRVAYPTNSKSGRISCEESYRIYFTLSGKRMVQNISIKESEITKGEKITLKAN
ncbi:MAG: hypothetical protein HQM10_14240 [Candidatus Riflebacteria bacterium]|nr:hypothetical protein [Candidatus Riflebacteria bacterium]